MDMHETHTKIELQKLQDKIDEVKKLLKSQNLETLHFLRHAKTEYNVKRIIQGYNAIDVQIDESQIDFDELDTLMSNKYDIVFCSNATRAMQTAKLINKHELSVLYKLNEIKWGSEDCKSMIGNSKYDDINWMWFDAPNKFACSTSKLDGGESLLEFANRILDAMLEMIQIISHSSYKKVLIVGHGLWSAVLFSMLKENHPSTLQYKLKNCEHTNILDYISNND